MISSIKSAIAFVTVSVVASKEARVAHANPASSLPGQRRIVAARAFVDTVGFDQGRANAGTSLASIVKVKRQVGRVTDAHAGLRLGQDGK